MGSGKFSSDAPTRTVEQPGRAEILRFGPQGLDGTLVLQLVTARRGQVVFCLPPELRQRLFLSGTVHSRVEERARRKKGRDDCSGEGKM